MQYDRSAAAVTGVRSQPERPRLLDEVRRRLRMKHYSLRTEQAYLYWIRRYIQANGRRHPREMGGAEVERFLSDLARKGRVAPSTQNQALSALLYGSGLRLMECLRLRVKDVDLERREIIVREGKGGKDRRTVLPESLRMALQAQLDAVRVLHARDLEAGFGAVSLPYALARKYRNAERELGWQYVFPATTQVYTHVLNRGAVGVLSPLDR